MRRLHGCLMAFVLAACAGGARPATTSDEAAVALGPSPVDRVDPRARDGRRTLSVLTYNVAGLPQWLSRARPRKNLPRIGELSNGYDLVLAQEDFAYPARLRRHTRFREQTAGERRRFAFNLGDGLSRFAHHPFGEVERVSWSTCHGRLRYASDCLASKGFSVATHAVMPGARLDVYNVHLDAGKADGDIEARRVQARQLADYVQRYSRGRAVLIVGDTNFRTRQDRRHLKALLRATGCRDVCKALRCPEPRRIDRIFFRSSAHLKLRPLAWQVDPRFVTSSGEPLSDHEAIAAVLEMTVVGNSPSRN